MDWTPRLRHRPRSNSFNTTQRDQSETGHACLTPRASNFGFTLGITRSEFPVSDLPSLSSHAVPRGPHPSVPLAALDTPRSFAPTQFPNMKTTTQSSTRTHTATPVAAALQQLLADSYALMGITHHAHWNVEGPDFFQLHTAFQGQYENLFEAVDDIAEQIRIIDSFPVGGLATLAKQAGIDELPVTAPAKDFVAALIVAHEKTLADAITLRDTAEAARDLETQDLAIGRISWHGKTLWMLKSYLK